MWRKLFKDICASLENILGLKNFLKYPLDKEQEFVLLVDEARREWQWANQFVQEVKDRTLIDQAIYYQSAAERRYIHLLKQAAKEGIKADSATMAFLVLTVHNSNSGGVMRWRTTFGKLP